MIKEIIEGNHQNIAFEFINIEYFKIFIQMTIEENIEFSKTLGVKFEEENTKLYEKYSKNMYIGYKCYVLICKYLINIDSDLYEYQFYSRSSKYYDTYTDWGKFKFIDFTKLIRDKKIEDILK